MRYYAIMEAIHSPLEILYRYDPLQSLRISIIVSIRDAVEETYTYRGNDKVKSSASHPAVIGMKGTANTYVAIQWREASL